MNIIIKNLGEGDIHYLWLGLGRDDIWDELALKGFQHANIVGHF